MIKHEVVKSMGMFKASSAALVVKSPTKMLEWFEGTKDQQPVSAITPFSVPSLRPSFYGLALLMVITEEGVPVDMPVYQFLYDIPQSQLGGISFRHLATGTAPAFIGPERWTSVTLMAWLVEAMSGDTVDAFLQKRVFQAMSFGSTGDWEAPPVNSDNEEIHPFYIHATDLCNWGQLFLQRGRWNDEIIVPSNVFALIDDLHKENEHSKEVLGWTVTPYGYAVTDGSGSTCAIHSTHNGVAVRLLNGCRSDQKDSFADVFARWLQDAE
ncbi:hypothetical protein [Aureibacillus halotolerans]|uniref:CubicO group peptidase (Beta-lactamase class C family) n=1 Tax=Aureibacillus halotolerans TaxID=1508390 RepID=A0A4V3D4L8_9BACI|nr:hypothetical protein [Aureibacillus halotolerans]TDQ36777.1 CubicO group peptidase (beta-lactamase class C family) [Aureibacillus halotolerans]